jgi:uncharacterized protein (DUF1330 family)
MKTATKMSLMGALGLACGALAMQVLQAQTVSPPAYLVANIESIHDEAGFAQYRAAVVKTQAAFGGHALVRYGVPVSVDSSTLPQGTIVILQFPSMKALQAWWNSPAYAAIRPLREKSSVARLFAVEGLPAP